MSMISPRQLISVQVKADKADTAVIFIVASDNPLWCQSYLLDAALNIEFAKSFHREIEGLLSEFLFDFALLSRSNHSVHSVIGTFSFWSSFLAGGAVFQPLDYPRQRKRLEMAVQIERAANPRYKHVVLPSWSSDGDARSKRILKEAESQIAP